MISIVIATIIAMESSGNPMAFNRATEARGLMQITPVVLSDYNKRNHANLSHSQLFSESINKHVGTWYLTVRIPELLQAKHKPVTLENVLICWCQGIKHVSKPSKQAKAYIKRYAELTKGNPKHESTNR